MTRRKRKARVKYSKSPHDKDILEELRSYFLTELSVQIASGKNTEEEFSELEPKKRKEVKEKSKKFVELTPGQRNRLKKKNN